MDSIIDMQMELCLKYKADFLESPKHLKIGVSLNVKQGIMPVNGLRHPASGDTSGWYIWSGEEFSEDPHFFQPLHIEHINDWCPNILKYLGLAPGWRFLITNDGYEDVWKDDSLLNG